MIDKKFEDMFFDKKMKYMSLFKEGKTEEGIQLLKEIWAQFPEPRLSNDLFYLLLEDIINLCISLKKFDTANKYIGLLIIAGLNRNDGGQKEFIAGKLAYEQGELDIAKELFYVAQSKSNGRLFKGKENEKYREILEQAELDKENQKKLKELEELALEGNADLQYNMGLLYEGGKDVKKDFNKALKFLKLASENGNSDAQCELGLIYCTGEDVNLDYKEGLKWYRMASSQNNALAQGNLGFMYENGYGVQQDYTMAFKYYMMSAQNGDVVAQNTIAKMYKDGIGVEKNIIESEKWSKIAENNDINNNNINDNGIEDNSSLKLSEDLYNSIKNLCSIGDELAADEKFDDALDKYMEALEYVPDPKENWEASTWIYAAIGDAYFYMDKYSEAKNSFFDALNCPEGMGNPFIHLRIGQCFYELNNIDRARDSLIKAYMLGGNDIFQDEDYEYFKVIKDLI